MSSLAMSVVRLARAFAAWVFTGLYWTVLLAAHALSFRQIPDTWIASLIHFWARAALAIAGIRVELVNESTIEGRDARVVIVNHQSALELVWGAMILPPGFLVIGKKEIIYVPIMNLIWWGMRLIRIDRSNKFKAHQALAGVAHEIVRNRRSLFIAPEGTRTRTGEMGPFKKGAFRIAAEARVPIYPVVVTGAFDVLPRGSLIPRKRVIRVYFLPPVSSEGALLESGSVSDEFVEKIRAQMVECERRIRAGR